jgi:hypothetical protein
VTAVLLAGDRQRADSIANTVAYQLHHSMVTVLLSGGSHDAKQMFPNGAQRAAENPSRNVAKLDEQNRLAWGRTEQMRGAPRPATERTRHCVNGWYVLSYDVATSVVGRRQSQPETV